MIDQVIKRQFEGGSEILQNFASQRLKNFSSVNFAYFLYFCNFNETNNTREQRG